MTKVKTYQLNLFMFVIFYLFIGRNIIPNIYNRWQLYKYNIFKLYNISNDIFQVFYSVKIIITPNIYITSLMHFLNEK